MIDDPVHLSIAFVAGVTMGAVYLTLLWASVQRLTSTSRPGRLLLASATLRIGLLMAGWYWIANGKWDGLIACLLGFLGARLIATRLVMRSGLKHMTTS